MNELKHIVKDMETVFAESRYPADFLAAYDQMECLASHTGRETFLVQRKTDQEMAVATCYDRRVFPVRPDMTLLGELSHPGLPRYYEQFQNDQMLCIVREYIEGETLADYARERQLSVEDVVSIAQRLCDILEVLHMHKPAVVHRDIKPENLIVKPDGQIVLIDFDIARCVKDGAGADTVFFGTKGYAPPEQYGFGQTDARADIYALGVLLRWMVTGSVRENRNITIDAALQNVIDRCTAFSPDDRYKEIRQVRQGLYRVGKRSARIRPKRAVLWLAAAVLLMLGGFAVGRYTNWFRPSQKTVFAEPLIEEAVRLMAGKENGTLTAEDLAEVKRLYIYGTEAFADAEAFDACKVDTSTQGPIRTLDDLALLPGLEELHIGRQGYVDVSGVAGLARLYTVDLKHMRISGAAPIADAPGLRHAILFDTGLTDVTALENCPWLETLDVGLNAITALKQIGAHPNVRSLGLMWLEMDNVDDLAAYLPKVQAVTLQHGHIGDMSGLRELPDLEAVYVLKEQEEEVKKVFAGTDVEIRITEN